MSGASQSFTVVLTKGAHTVRAEDAAAIFAAIETGKKLVQVDLELYPGSQERRSATIVTAHVIAVSRVEKPSREVVSEAGDKVRGLWEYRSG